jgi:hypothetical protein
VVLRIRDARVVLVAIPDRIDTDLLRSLARTVLSPVEYDELHRTLGLTPDTGPPPHLTTPGRPEN